jgi:hypothetical protein
LKSQPRGVREPPSASFLGSCFARSAIEELDEDEEEDGVEDCPGPGGGRSTIIRVITGGGTGSGDCVIGSGLGLGSLPAREGEERD